MSRPVVGIADTAFGNHDLIADDFAERADVRRVDLSGGPATTLATRGVDAVVVTLQRLDSRVIESFAPSVRVIGRAGVGLDTIDLSAATERGIAVVNEPAYGAAEVATHALAMLLCLHRRLREGDEFVRAGWSGPAPVTDIAPLDEARIAVLGAGRIGRAFIDRVRPLVREVVVFDPGDVDGGPGVVRSADLASALSGSDAVSLHLPLLPHTRDLIGSAQLRQLNRGAVVINVSRGGIVDEQALADELDSGWLGGAGLDVFAEEPLPPTSPLLRAPRTLFTPHSAAASSRSAYRLSHWTVSDVIDYLATRQVSYGTVVAAPDGRAQTPVR